MRGTPSRSTTSASLPIARSTWQNASAEPTASPSGRACEVSKNRLRCPICFKTSSSITTSLSRSAAPLPVAVQQFVDSGFVLLRSIELKKQLRWTAQVQPLRNFVPNKTDRRSQPCERKLRFGIVAFHGDQNTRRTSILSQFHRAHVYPTYSWITQLAFDDGLDLLAQRLGQPLAMIFLPALFHCLFTWSKTNEDIRKPACHASRNRAGKVLRCICEVKGNPRLQT